MKSLLVVLALAGLSIPMMACEHTVASNDRTTQHWDGTVSHDQKTVKENTVTGERTVEEQKTRY